MLRRVRRRHARGRQDRWAAGLQARGLYYTAALPCAALPSCLPNWLLSNLPASLPAGQPACPHLPAHCTPHLPAGFAAVVAAILFFLATFLSPLFGQIPAIATSPILVLVGVLIFASAVGDINWEDMSGECFLAQQRLIEWPGLMPPLHCAPFHSTPCCPPAAEAIPVFTTISTMVCCCACCVRCALAGCACCAMARCACCALATAIAAALHLRRGGLILNSAPFEV